MHSWETVSMSILKEKVQTANLLAAQKQGATLLLGRRANAPLQSSVGRFCGWSGTSSLQGSLFFNTDVANSVGLLLNVIHFKTVPEFVWVDIFLSQIFLLFLSPLTPCRLPRQLRTSRWEGRWAALPGSHVKVALLPEAAGVGAPCSVPSPWSGMQPDCEVLSLGGLGAGLGLGVHRQPAVKGACLRAPSLRKGLPWHQGIALQSTA